MRPSPHAWSSMASTSRRGRWLLVLLLLVLASASVRPGSLLSVNPTGASAGVTINLTGTGFNTTAASNSVTFTPSAPGQPVSAPATSVITIDAANGTRRLSVRVPGGLPVGRADLKVTNTATGEASTGAALDVVTISLPEIAAGARGAQGLNVRIIGSANATFVAGTRPSFGAGITVTGVRIDSATSLLATLSIASTAALGPRNVSVTASTQSLLASGAFEVTALPPANRTPVANANGPYEALTNQAISFSSAGSMDPDGDPLDFAWTFGDGGTSSDANPQHAYATAGTYTATLTVSDRRGGTATANAIATVTNPITLSSLSVTPNALRFSELNVTSALVVTGRFTDGSERNLTASTTGTTYAMSESGVVTVGDDGVVTSLANGIMTITVANSGVTASTAVVVERGVVLQSLELTPPVTTLRELGATAQTIL